MRREKCGFGTRVWREKNSSESWKGTEPQAFLPCLNLIPEEERLCCALPVGSTAIVFAKIDFFFSIFFLKASFERDAVGFLELEMQFAADYLLDF